MFAFVVSACFVLIEHDVIGSFSVPTRTETVGIGATDGRLVLKTGVA
jgi:hypothetical protein